MTRKTDTLSAAYFEEKYKADIDPWRFRSSTYEREKHEATIGMLRKPLYSRALEVGCSIGVLTGLLAARCRSVVAIDASETAIAAANASGPSNVSFEVRTLPAGFPDGGFDLIVLSEVLYYFSLADLQKVAQRCIEAVSPDGDFVVCHWLGLTDYPLSGVDASEHFARAVIRKMPVRSIVQNETYRLERFSRRSASA